MAYDIRSQRELRTFTLFFFLLFPPLAPIGSAHPPLVEGPGAALPALA